MLEFLRKNFSAIKFGLLGGFIEALYCGFVVFLFWALEQSQPETVFPMGGFLLVLLLFVVSAGISGLLVFGYPLYLFLNKRFGEGLAAATTSLCTLGILGLTIFIIIFLIY